jgi:DNA-directed RNA polymerase specialized sigma24 family protein
VNKPKFDLELCEQLAQRGASGDTQACHHLVEHLWPVWVAMVRTSRSMGSLARSDDHVHNVVARLVAKIADQDQPALRLYPAWRMNNSGKTFADWMRIVTSNLVRDYAREQLGSQRPGADEPSVKRLLNELTLSPLGDALGIRPAYTANQTAGELMEFAQSRLPKDQLNVLGYWLQGQTFDEIDQELGLMQGQSRRLLRAAIAVLRRHFGTSGHARNDVS